MSLTLWTDDALHLTSQKNDVSFLPGTDVFPGTRTTRVKNMERSFQDGSDQPVDPSVDVASPVDQGKSPMNSNGSPDMIPSTTMASQPPMSDHQTRGPQTMMLAVLYHNPRPRFRGKENRPPDNLLCSILSCLCCFWLWPVGICAIIYSYKTQQANRRHDFTTATLYSKMTKYLIIATIVGGISMLNTFVLLFLFLRNSL